MLEIPDGTANRPKRDQAASPVGTRGPAARRTRQGSPGAFTKFAPAFDAGVHTHTNDIWIVVLKGAYVYRTDEGEKRIGANGFIRIPGGTKHWSGGDAKEGALFYEEAAGKFDLTPVK